MCIQQLLNQTVGGAFGNIQTVLDIPKSSTYSLIQELLDAHYLLFNNDSKKYYAGSAYIALCSSCIQNTDLLEELSILTSSLGQELNLTTHAGILDHLNVIYLAHYENNSNISLMHNLGQRIPAHCTALGKMLLSQFSNETLLQMYENYSLEKLTEKSIDNTETLLCDLKLTRERGYAMEICEASPYTACISLPLLKNGELIAAFSITMPLHFFETCDTSILIATMTKYKQITEQRLFSF